VLNSLGAVSVVDEAVGCASVREARLFAVGASPACVDEPGSSGPRPGDGEQAERVTTAITTIEPHLRPNPFRMGPVFHMRLEATDARLLIVAPRKDAGR